MAGILPPIALTGAAEWSRRTLGRLMARQSRRALGLVLGLALIAAAATGAWRLNRSFPDYDQWFAVDVPQAAMVIDARGTLSYSRGHMPGAPRLWSRDLLSYSAAMPGVLKSAEEIAGIVAALGLEPGREVVAYDQGTGADAPLVVMVLTSLGVSARVLDGGFDAWVEGGGAVSTEVVAPGPGVGADVWAPDGPLLVSLEAVRQTQTTGDAALADARGAIDLAIGHLEMAVHLSAAQMAPNGGLPRWSDVAFLVSPTQIQTGTPVVVYGNDLAEAAHTWLSLQAYGIDRVQVFAGPFQVLANADLAMEVPLAGAPVRASSVCFGAPVAE